MFRPILFAAVGVLAACQTVNETEQPSRLATSLTDCVNSEKWHLGGISEIEPVGTHWIAYAKWSAHDDVIIESCKSGERISVTLHNFEEGDNLRRQEERFGAHGFGAANALRDELVEIGVRNSDDQIFDTLSEWLRSPTTRSFLGHYEETVMITEACACRVLHPELRGDKIPNNSRVPA